MDKYIDVNSLDQILSHKSALIREQCEAQETSPDRESALAELIGIAEHYDTLSIRCLA